MIDVSQVLEFPSAKFYLLKQLPINIITHISTLKVTLSRSREVRTQWKERLFYHTRISKRELHKRRICLKYRAFDARITGT